MGAFAALFTSLNTMFRIMEELVCGHVGRISENYGSIRNYAAFLDLEPVNGTSTEIGEGNPEIRAEHLDFCYPGCETEVLKDVSFVVRPGERCRKVYPSESSVRAVSSDRRMSQD